MFSIVRGSMATSVGIHGAYLVGLLRHLKSAHVRHPRLALAGKIGAVGLIFWLICWTRLDPDFGWHLQAGNFIRAHGIPAHDVFTYTARSFPWIDHEWASDVLFSLLYSLGGFLLLSILCAALWTTALFVNDRRAPLIILLIAVSATLTYVAVRPVVWTVLGLVILMKLATSTSRWRPLWIPVLFILWANLHGGFIVGICVLAYYAVMQRRLLLAALVPVSVVAGFINPYGPGLYTELLRTLFDSSLHAEINEWRTFFIPAHAWIFVGLWAIGFWLYRSKKLINWIGVGPLLLASALSATRNLPLFVAATVSDLHDFYDHFRRSLPANLTRAPKLILVLFVLVGCTWLAWVYIGFFRSAQQWSEIYPVQAVAYLRVHPCQGRLFNEYDFGGYLIWQLPSEPVYIDGRMPSWRDSTGRTYFDQYNQVFTSPAYQRQQFAKYDIRCVLLKKTPVGNKLMDRLESAGWTDAMETQGYKLIVAPRV